MPIFTLAEWVTILEFNDLAHSCNNQWNDDDEHDDDDDD